MKVAVITDSGSNLTKKYIEANKNLDMLSLLLSIDGKFYRDQVEIDTKTVYKKLMETNVQTSLPNMEDFTNSVNKFKAEGYTDILVISISSNLSGTFNAFRLAINDIKDINFHLYDTKTLSMAQGYLVEEAIELIKKNTPIEDIIKKLDELRFKNSIAMYTVETLKWLKKGGRIGLVEGTIGEILHVKPVISVNDDGVYYTISKGFGLKRALITMRKALVEFFGNDLVELTIHYGDNLDQAKAVEEKLMNELNVSKISLTPLTPVLGVHTGPGIIAMVGRRV